VSNAPKTPSGPPDPGWRDAVRLGPRLLLPQLVIRRVTTESNRVVFLRMVWLTFVTFHVVVGGLLVLLLSAVNGRVALDRVTAVVGTLVVGVAVTIRRSRMARRPIECTDGPTVAIEYTSAYLRQCATVAIITPIGVLASLLSGSPWPLVLALAIALGNFASLRPVQAFFAADGARLVAQGCGVVDLFAVLCTNGAQGGPPPGAGGNNGPGGNPGGNGGAGGDDAPGRPGTRRRRRR
jgi:hypothetical protein